MWQYGTYTAHFTGRERELIWKGELFIYQSKCGTWNQPHNTSQIHASHDREGQGLRVPSPLLFFGGVTSDSSQKQASFVCLCCAQLDLDSRNLCWIIKVNAECLSAPVSQVISLPEVKVKRGASSLWCTFASDYVKMNMQGSPLAPAAGVEASFLPGFKADIKQKYSPLASFLFLLQEV